MITFRSSFQTAMAGFPPNALSNQQRILESRFPPTRSAGDDDGRSTTGSVSSWINVNGEEEEDDRLVLPPADLSFSRMDPIPEQSSAPPVPPPVQTAAPVTQAARNFVDHVNEPAAARRLRRQQEMASRKGKKGARFVQLGAHNACNIALPQHIQQVGSGRQAERSIMVLTTGTSVSSHRSKAGS